MQSERIRRWPRSEWLPPQDAFFEACREEGFDESQDLNAPDASGVGPLPTNNLSPLVGSNLTALQPTILDQRTLTFRGDHRLSEHRLQFERFSLVLRTVGK